MIVGAGSAGCVAAATFAAAGASVILLEAGPIFGAGASWPDALLDPTTLPVGPGSEYVDALAVHLAPGVDAWVGRGRVLGGSGSVNGAYFVRSPPADFDAWPQDHWSWPTVREFFRRSETDLDFGATADHGGSGPMPVSRAAASPLARAFEVACSDAGYRRVPDLNAADAGTGFGAVPTNIRGGIRVGTAAAFLEPVRSAVTVCGGASVARVLFARERAVGVAGRGADGDFEVHADRVVLAAGAVRTATVLLHSGVGDPEMLRANGIEVRTCAPGVGRGFADHPEVAVPYRRRGSAEPGPVLQSVLHTDSVELRPYATSFDRVIAGLSPVDPVVGVAHLTPEARGRLSLVSADPFAAPRLEYGYLRTAADRRALEDGVEIARSLLASSAMADVVRDVGAPAPLADRLGTSVHLTGTARMGEDDGAVVDSRCEVRGTTALTVIDSSMFPAPPTRGPHATVVMAALRASTLLVP